MYLGLQSIIFVIIDDVTIPTPGDLRLLDNNGVVSSAGRLEIFFSSNWGTICDIGFDEVDADVACRQMGFQYASREGTVGELGYGST